MQRKFSGFTLIELMIVVALVAILAAVAMPSYRQYIVRSNRVAAQAVMMEIANKEQQYFLANRAYSSSLTDLGVAVPSDVGSRYSCTTTPGAGLVPTYSIKCEPVAGSTQDGDGDLILDNLGNKTGKW